MPRIKAPKSKRMSSKQRHKIDRKKREHKRDLRKAAKALKEKGLGPQRSKKTRNVAKLALQISNAHPDKEVILNSVLKARENARVEKYERRKRMRDQEEEVDQEKPREVPSNLGFRQLLYIPPRDSNNFKVQFLRSLTELVFPLKPSHGVAELPSVAYVVTLDCRFAVQSIPWTLLDAIVEHGRNYQGPREKILLLFTFTKVDLVSISALITQVSLVGCALREHFDGDLGKHIVATVAPLSIQHEKTGRHVLKLLQRFAMSEGCHCHTMESNLQKKICTFVIGLPNTGRRSLCRALSSDVNDSTASVVPLRAAQLQIKNAGNVAEVRFALPNANSVVFLTFPEDTEIRNELKTPSGGDIMFKSHLFVEKIPEPEALGSALFAGVLDKRALAQAFCQAEVVLKSNEDADVVAAAEKFMRDLGRTVRQEKGFHVSPLFVSSSGTMSQQTSSHLSAHVNFTSGQKRSQETLLDATYSNATPSKLIRISSVITTKKGNKIVKAEKVDGRNTLRLGARTFVRELCQGRYVPWAVMRASGMKTLTIEEVESASLVFDTNLAGGKQYVSSQTKDKDMNAKTHMETLIQNIQGVINHIAIFLPNAVVEMNPDAIVPPQYELEDAEDDSAPQANDEEEGENQEGDDEEAEDQEEGDDEEAEDQEEDDEDDESDDS